MKGKSVRVIFDTNVWISYLIGKRLSSITTYLASGQIVIISTNQLLLEIKEVTGRQKLRKYFPKQSVTELVRLLEVIAISIDIKPTHTICSNPKDNFLLDLIDFSEIDYLITGDKELLKHNPFMTASILTAADFETEFISRII